MNAPYEELQSLMAQLPAPLQRQVVEYARRLLHGLQEAYRNGMESATLQAFVEGFTRDEAEAFAQSVEATFEKATELKYPLVQPPIIFF